MLDNEYNRDFEIDLSSLKDGFDSLNPFLQKMSEGLDQILPKQSTPKVTRLLEMCTGSYFIPKQSGSPLGEDAHTIHYKQAIGVADGVGGWAKKGVDSGRYARSLMFNARCAIDDEPDKAVDPKRVLIAAHENTKITEGSSTACIVALNGKLLSYANVGDSGFLLIRDREVLYRTHRKRHHFKHPFQLGHGDRSDDPRMATCGRLNVQPGDVLVVATNGLFDNMYETQLLDILREDVEKKSPKELARRIAKSAKKNSRDKSFESPYAKLSNILGHEHKGGRVDDITVVVAIIQQPARG